MKKYIYLNTENEATPVKSYKSDYSTLETKCGAKNQNTPVFISTDVTTSLTHFLCDFFHNNKHTFTYIGV